MLKETIIFTDGASKGNPGTGGWGAIIVSQGKVLELGGEDKRTTNNRMELTGAIKALVEISGVKDSILVYTDSKYVINGVTGWIYVWQKNNWKTKEKKDVLNKDLWEKLVELVKDKKIKWNYVGGHVGVAGNERCDEIADALATNQKVDLYKGDIFKYNIDISNLGHDEIKKAIKNNKGAKAYSYLSLVDGILNIDSTWAECEKRVKGKKGVKYKKSISKENEQEIIKSWGQNE